MGPMQAIAALKAIEGDLRARGVAGVLLFGSVAPSEADAASDIDVLLDIAQEASFSLFDQASLAVELSERLGARVDLVTRDGLHPALRPRIEPEAVRVF
jgi:predicted nucleotidyltransferase